ncbi:MAG: hypothetical protein AAB610_00200 [Patescibacteria group bacterium]
MKKDITTILSSMKNVRLSADEKSSMKERLIADIKPAPSASFSVWHSIIWSHQMKVGYAVILAAVSLGIPAVFASEYALPGDLLYSVKTGVVEKVERAFISSAPLAQAKYETKLVERRFQEAEKLSDSKSDFKEEAKTNVKKEIEKQTEKAEKAVAKVRVAKVKPPQAKDNIEAEKQNVSSLQMTAAEDDSDKDKNDEARKQEKDVRIMKSAEKWSENEDQNRRTKSDDSDRKKYISKSSENDSDEDEDEINLEKVFEKHENIVKKLDIRRTNRLEDRD